MGPLHWRTALPSMLFDQLVRHQGTWRTACLSFSVANLAGLSMPTIPLSAFVVEDMVELQQAHGTYRFVIFDEEEERPRLLVSLHAGLRGAVTWLTCSYLGLALQTEHSPSVHRPDAISNSEERCASRREDSLPHSWTIRRSRRPSLVRTFSWHSRRGLISRPCVIIGY